MSELGENEARVLKALASAEERVTTRKLAEQTGLADTAIARAILSLSSRGFVNEYVEKSTEIQFTREGESYFEKGLPERRVSTIVLEAGGRLPLKKAVEEAGLTADYVPIVAGWVSHKKWGKIQGKGDDTELVIVKQPEKDADEQLISLVDHKTLALEDLPGPLRDAVDRLVRRNLLESRVRSERLVQITSEGRGAAETLVIPTAREVSGLTGEMISSGEWEHVRLRSYNVSSPVPPVWAGRLHPYARFLSSVKRKLVALGFREVTGPLVEFAFINCDCLYMPQDHPAREVHDLYYLRDPSKGDLSIWNGLVNRVKETHENGWKTGSRGWGYNYSIDEASRLIMRSHGTATSVRALLSKELTLPGKYFAIARCYRPDPLDKTHLMEFNQVEGIVVDESLNLRSLLGVLEMFAKQVAGADRVRFKPDYFPFTEPSVELQAYKEGFGWLEFGGSGIFRPEVTTPLGVNTPVIAWGLGIDRLYMMKRSISDIRQLFSPDLKWIREQEAD